MHNISIISWGLKLQILLLVLGRDIAQIPNPKWYEKLTRVSISVREVDWEARTDLQDHAQDTRGILFGVLGQDVQDVLTSACVSVCMCMSVCV